MFNDYELHRLEVFILYSNESEHTVLVNSVSNVGIA